LLIYLKTFAQLFFQNANSQFIYPHEY